MAIEICFEAQVTVTQKLHLNSNAEKFGINESNIVEMLKNERVTTNMDNSFNYLTLIETGEVIGEINEINLENDRYYNFEKLE